MYIVDIYIYSGKKDYSLYRDILIGYYISRKVLRKKDILPIRDISFFIRRQEQIFFKSDIFNSFIAFYLKDDIFFGFFWLQNSLFKIKKYNRKTNLK